MKFCTCGKLFEMFDNFDERTLYHYCSTCNVKIPYETSLIYTKQNTTHTKHWIKYDKSLPLSEKQCYKCYNPVIYEKRSDLTLRYICTTCNEQWS